MFCDRITPGNTLLGMKLLRGEPRAAQSLEVRPAEEARECGCVALAKLLNFTCSCFASPTGGLMMFPV